MFQVKQVAPSKITPIKPRKIGNAQVAQVKFNINAKNKKKKIKKNKKNKKYKSNTRSTRLTRAYRKIRACKPQPASNLRAIGI